MSKPTRAQHIEDAATAHSDLNVFYAVIALMEASLISSKHHAAEGRIVKICKDEGARCLRDYDLATARAIKEPRQ